MLKGEYCRQKIFYFNLELIIILVEVHLKKSDEFIKKKQEKEKHRNLGLKSRNLLNNILVYSHM